MWTSHRRQVEEAFQSKEALFRAVLLCRSLGDASASCLLGGLSGLADNLSHRVLQRNYFNEEYMLKEPAGMVSLSTSSVNTHTVSDVVVECEEALSAS